MKKKLAEALTALVARLDCPILAEPLSNLRFGPHDRSRVCLRYNNRGGAIFDHLPQPALPEFTQVWRTPR